MLLTVDPAVKRAIDEQIARAQQNNEEINNKMTELKSEDQALLDEIDSYRPRHVRLQALILW